MSVSAILARTHAERPLTDVAGDCLIWEGAVQSSGYGCVNGGLVHRVVYEASVRKLARGETIDHLCRRVLCVNVQHHEPVSRSENTRRRLAAQTRCKHGHPLSGENLRLVRRSNGYTYRVCVTCQRGHVQATRRKAEARADVALLSELRGLIESAGLTVAAAARLAGIPQQGLSRRLSGETPFRDSEVVALREAVAA